MCEISENGRVLQIRREDDSMLPEIQPEAVPAPPADGFDHLERPAAEKILQGPSDAQPVAFERRALQDDCNFLETLEEIMPRQWPKTSTVTPRKKRPVRWRAVDCEVVG